MTTAYPPARGRYYIRNRDVPRKLPARAAAEACDCQHVKIDRRPWSERPSLDREATAPPGHSDADEDELVAEVRHCRHSWASGW